MIGDYTSGSEVYNKYTESIQVIDFLSSINNELEGSPFKIAYRVRDEFLIYCYYARDYNNPNWLSEALDQLFCMKILSRVEGDESKISNILVSLQNILKNRYPISNNKLFEMESRLQKTGYTSYWI